MGISIDKQCGIVLSLLVLGCRGGDLTLPSDGSPSTLRVVSGNGQLGEVKSQLPKPLVVQLTDASARPVRGEILNFLTDVPQAELSPATIATNDSGYASVEVRLGNREGTQTVEARLANPASELSARFALTAVKEPGDDHGRDGDGDEDRADGGGAGGGGQGGGGGHGHGSGHDD